MREEPPAAGAGIIGRRIPMSQVGMESRYLLDRAAIRDVLVRYFRGLDRADPELVRSCFTEDVRAHYEGRPPMRGIEAFMGSLRTFRRLDAGEMQITTHFMGNLSFDVLEGDLAETETNAIAFLVPPQRLNERMAVRSLRYIDRWRRTDAGWQICERCHTLDWSFEATTGTALTLAQRITALPGG